MPSPLATVSDEVSRLNKLDSIVWLLLLTDPALIGAYTVHPALCITGQSELLARAVMLSDFDMHLVAYRDPYWCVSLQKVLKLSILHSRVHSHRLR